MFLSMGQEIQSPTQLISDALQIRLDVIVLAFKNALQHGLEVEHILIPSLGEVTLVPFG